MNKEETIERYGEDAYERQLAQGQAWNKEHPEEVIANSQEQHRKGGKYYEAKSENDRTGLRGERNKIRRRHRGQYQPYKAIIAPESQIHHEWIPDTAEYQGVALVEAKPHQYGIIDVIEILEGKITVLTEEEKRAKQIKKNHEVKKDEQ